MRKAIKHMRYMETRGFVSIGSSVIHGNTRKALKARGLTDEGYLLNERGRALADDVAHFARCADITT